jgi:hypothetical protein
MFRLAGSARRYRLGIMAKMPLSGNEQGTTRVALCGMLCAIGAVILIAGTALMAVVTFLPGFDRPGSHLRGIANMLYADYEANIWAWYASVLLAALAVTFGLHAYVQRNAGAPFRPFLALGALAVYMSADEAAILHEKFSNVIPSVTTWGWLAIGVPSAAAVGAGALWLTRTMEQFLRRRLIVAGAIFLLGAVFVEAIAGVTVVQAGSYDAGTHTPFYMVLLAVEEFLELAGVVIALWAALAALHVRRGPSGLRVLAAAELVREAPARPRVPSPTRLRAEDIMDGPQGD